MDANKHAREIHEQLCSFLNGAFKKMDVNKHASERNERLCSFVDANKHTSERNERRCRFLNGANMTVAQGGADITGCSRKYKTRKFVFRAR